LERKRSQFHTKKRAIILPKIKFNLFNQYILLLALILTGAAIGALYIGSIPLHTSKIAGTGIFMQDILSSGAASKGFVSLSISAFFPVSLLLCTAFLLGLCAIGLPFELLVPILHGAWIGSSMAVIDTEYGMKGLGICLLFILPQALITSASVMVASREGIRFSRSVSKAVFSGTQESLSASFRRYCSKYIGCYLLIVAASMVEAASILIFSRVFLS
jgi:uncharacterized membrane protein SpoIIM required for sporulation